MGERLKPADRCGSYPTIPGLGVTIQGGAIENKEEKFRVNTPEGQMCLLYRLGSRHFLNSFLMGVPVSNASRTFATG